MSVLMLSIVLLYDLQLLNDISLDTPPREYHVETEDKQTASLFIVGDIMLGRDVEMRIQKYGEMYPYVGVSALVAQHDAGIGNFEGTIPPLHVPTPPFTFRFSIHEDRLQTLNSIGFTILSLANNHAYDYGVEALTHTRDLCRTYNVSCVGSPVHIDAFSTAKIEIGTYTVGFFAFQTVTTSFSTTSILDVFESLNATDYKIAYVHWGDEYAETHTKMQEIIAHALIDTGFDAVVGHHPHVIQDIEMYKGKPIFYSLGNFIFDQYFSTAVTQGLALSLLLSPFEAQYTLIPISSTSTRAQPQVATGEERAGILERISKGIVFAPGYTATSGVLRIVR
jgi:hypothetical protein